MKVTVGTKSPFAKNIVFIEGISRGGKFLIGNLVHCVDDIEPVQYSGLLEQIPNYMRFGLMDPTLGQQMIRCDVDMRCYETVIGRFFNSRVADKSYLGLMRQYKEVMSRSREPDADKLVHSFISRRRYALFILHESMINIKIFLELFPQSRIIHVQRHPIDLVYSWYQRHLLARWGKDSLVFQIPFQKDDSIPWFALDWEKEYIHRNEMDKVIGSICRLQEIERQAIAALSAVQKKRFCFLHFEKVVMDPKRTIARLSTFLGKPRMKGIQKILYRERLPAPNPCYNRVKKLEYIAKYASSDYLRFLDKASITYAQQMTHET